MKKKLILLLVLSMLALQACTLRICTPTYVDAVTGKQQYACIDKRVGPAAPVFTFVNEARQMHRR